VFLLLLLWVLLRARVFWRGEVDDLTV